MGKSRRNRAGTVRANPMAAPPKPVKAPADPALAALRETAVLPVVRDLRSADPAKRTAAAGAIANVVAHDDAAGRVRKLLLREQVVHVVLTETLTDARIESRAAGWAVLVVLALHEAPDFCVHLYRCDVLTPAAHALGQAVDALLGPGRAATAKAEARFAWTVATAVLDLVGQLASARDEILDAVLTNAALGRGFAALATGVVPAQPGDAAAPAAAAVAIPPPVQWAALTGLGRLLMGDDRPAPERKPQQALAKALVEDGPVYGVLRGLAAAGGGPLAVAAASLLHTVFAALEWFDHSPGPDGESDAVLVPALAGALRRELQQQEQRRQTKGQEASTEGDDADTAQDQSDQVSSLALQTLAMMGTTLSRSLEKGNVAEAVWDGIQDDDGNELTIDGNDDSEGEEEEDDDDDEDRDMTDAAAAPRKAANGHSGGGMDIDMEEDGGGDSADDDDADDGDMADLDRDMEAVTGGADDADQQGGLEDLATLQALLTVAIPQTIEWIEARSAAPAPSTPDADPLLLEGLAVLNNCAWTLSCLDADDAGNAALLQAWAPTAEAIWCRVVRPLLAKAVPQDGHASGGVEDALASPLAGLAWAVARVLRGATPVDGGDVDGFVALHRLSSGGSGARTADADGDPDPDPFQSLPVKCLGVLGQLAQGAAAPLDRNRAVGRYLVGVVAALPATPAAEAVEALDQLFDLYGDETAACDRGVFWPEGFLERLAAAAAPVKALAKTVDKRTDAELRTRADEAVLNLRRFLQYKKKHAP